MQELIDLEQRGWQALSDGSAAEFFSDLLTDDAVMMFPGIGVLTRAATLAAMEQAPPWSWFRIEEAQVLSLTEASAVVHYRATAQRENEPEYRALMNSTYVRIDGAWRMALHQHSPEPA